MDPNETDTKNYTDGTTATGTAPLPEQSPAQQDQAGADAVLASAASTATGDTPTIEPQPPEIAAAEPVEQPKPVIYPVRTLDAARALPEFEPPTADSELPPLFEHDDPTAIRAFKDTDGRTMRVVVVDGALAKFEA